MGRPRKPNSLKILQGDQPCRINLNEPTSPGGLGDPPEWFEDDPFALEGWSVFARELAPLKVATFSDRQAAAHYAEAYSDYRQARDLVKLDGMKIEETKTVKSMSGPDRETTSYKANPLLVTMRESRKQMMAILGQFGMTPSARAHLVVQSTEGEIDPLLEFVKNGGRKTRSR